MSSTSADGVVTAVVDEGNASVLLRVDLAGSESVQVYRTDAVTGEATLVRSGDPCLVSAGVGFAYDHEVQPGRLVSYTVTDEAGVVRGGVSVIVPWGETDAWVKCPADPSLSRQVKVMAPLDEDYAGRTSLLDLAGSSAVFATWDVEGPWTGTLRLRARGRTDVEDLSALLRHPGVLLLQASDAHGLPDSLYFARTGRSLVRPGDMPGWELRDQLVPAVQVLPQATFGARMRMPRWGWVEAVAPFATLPEVEAAYPTHWDMLLAGVGR